MTTLLLAPLPVLAVVVLIVLGAMPWFGVETVIGTDLAEDLVTRLPGFLSGLSISGPDGLAMALALLPVGAVYFWSMRRPRLMPAVAVLGCGLLLDVATQGPLGVWPVATLSAALAGRWSRRSRRDANWLSRLLQAVLALSVAAGSVAGIMTVVLWDVAALRPLVLALPVALLAYPLVAGGLSLLDRLWPAAMSRSLFLRGD